MFWSYDYWAIKFNVINIAKIITHINNPNTIVKFLGVSFNHFNKFIRLVIIMIKNKIIIIT